VRIYLDGYFTVDNHERRLDECLSREGEIALDDILEGKNPLCGPVSQRVFIDKGDGRVPCKP
jgi:hypothetical protein